MYAVRSLRKERGWSQQRLAAEAGINKVTLVHIETGKTSPNVETLEKLAGALGVELGDFFPKAQAPLPLESEPAAGHTESASPDASFVEAWTSYVCKRARGWEEALPKGARALRIFTVASGRPPEGVPGLIEELHAKPKLAFEILQRSEVALSELSALLETLAVVNAMINANAGAAELRNSGRQALSGHVVSGALVIDAGEKWSISEQVARDVVGNTAGVTEELTEAAERARRAAEEHQKVVALFKERQSA